MIRQYGLQLRSVSLPSFRLLLSFQILLSLFIFSCGTKLDLPTAENTDSPVFSAGDTSFIRINPDWDNEHDYMFKRPWDIVVGRDGYIFVANHDIPTIHVLNSSGVSVTVDEFGNDFSPLLDLRDSTNNPVLPMAITQDNKLNLIIADSSNRLFVWDQYCNNVGIQALAERVLFSDNVSDTIWVTRPDSFQVMLDNGYILQDFVWTTEGIDTWLGLRLFWDGNDSLEALKIQNFYGDANAVRITGITAATGEKCYMADASSNTIFGLNYKSAALAVTGANQLIMLYKGSVYERVALFGTGNGTVNDPRGMTEDSQDAIYYTQWGEYFGVHKIRGEPVFDTGIHDIMDLDRFNRPSDIAVDIAGNIYVADTGNDRIQQFDARGQFIVNIGMRKVYMDTTLIDSTFSDSGFIYTESDTTLTLEVADILDKPRAVAVDANGIVYITDTNNDRIMRYRLPTELDYGD